MRCDSSLPIAASPCRRVAASRLREQAIDVGFVESPPRTPLVAGDDEQLVRAELAVRDLVSPLVEFLVEWADEGQRETLLVLRAVLTVERLEVGDFDQPQRDVAFRRVLEGEERADIAVEVAVREVVERAGVDLFREWRVAPPG